MRPATGRAHPRAPRNADYEALFRLTSTPTLEVDPAGSVVAANKAAVRLLQTDLPVVPGTDLTTLLGDRALETLGTDAPIDVVVQLPEGPTALRLFATSRELSAGPAPHRIVQVIRREGRAAQDADRRAPSGSMALIDDVSHNLGTPLAIVAGYAETLRDRWGEMSPQEVATATDAIGRHAQRAVDELRGIQARVRTLNGGTGTVPTNLLLAWLRRMLAAPLAATGSVLVEGSVAAQVTVDTSITRQALLSVCQALLGAERPAVEVVVDASVDDEGTTFRVTGVDLGELREDHVAMLEVTRSVIADVGGHYEFDDEGRIHSIRLPSRRRAASSPIRIPVAVIEDDPDAAALIRASLRALGGVFEIVADERTLRAGLIAVAETQPRILLLDQVLPDGHGTEIIDRVTELSPRTTVVVLSARGQDAASEDAGAGAGDDSTGRLHWLEKGRVMANLGGELLGVLAAG